MSEEEPIQTFPVNEQIMQAIAAKLAGMSVANGYAHDYAGVNRPRRTGEQVVIRDKAMFLHLEDDSPTGQGECGNPPIIEMQLDVAVQVFLRHPERDERPMDQVFLQMKADVVKALLADVQLGGLARNAQLGPSTILASDGCESLVVLFGIIYAVAENDMYTPM